KITLVGFGTFSVGSRSQREGRNPRTGEKIKIPASKVVKFKAGKTLSEKVK
ncbi:MAG TPA: DNA-binding protein, partial [Deltaproteobacteria bacterium]|nr:DNA-binding protein [Deltaproteobacteria bacterium]